MFEFTVSVDKLGGWQGKLMAMQVCTSLPVDWYVYKPILDYTLLGSVSNGMPLLLPNKVKT